jgi:molybdopterin synthase sulfur carrier subunit
VNLLLPHTGNFDILCINCGGLFAGVIPAHGTGRQPVIVHAYGTLRLVVGGKNVVVDVPPGASILDVLLAAARAYPGLDELMFDARGQVRADFPVFVNGRNPRLLPESIHQALGAQDVLSLFSPVSSGRMNVEVLRTPRPGTRRGTMKVHFFATLRDIAGGKTFEFPADGGITAGALLRAIIERFPAMERELLDEDGYLYGHVHFFVNGRDVQFLEENFSTKIQPGDVINVFPAVGGG